MKYKVRVTADLISQLLTTGNVIQKTLVKDGLPKDCVLTDVWLEKTNQPDEIVFIFSELSSEEPSEKKILLEQLYNSIIV